MSTGLTITVYEGVETQSTVLLTFSFSFASIEKTRGQTPENPQHKVPILIGLKGTRFVITRNQISLYFLAFLDVIGYMKNIERKI